ncbi:unnamed protein product [Peronospora belbahrii]|uniref:Uncharacterized protein n=1 Tax=Peronospora belbahrii TaxID=622444 RepID=A0AAU9LMB5_9STRA|nr:unnamed protein product [Peronospora belbahrii]
MWPDELNRRSKKVLETTSKVADLETSLQQRLQTQYHQMAQQMTWFLKTMQKNLLASGKQARTSKTCLHGKNGNFGSVSIRPSKILDAKIF